MPAMSRIAVFPGSFDPPTKGHESIVRRALPLFDRIIVALGENSMKTGYFPAERRLNWLRQVFASLPAVAIETYDGLTTDFCRKRDIGYIIRGLRTAADFDFERGIAIMNRKIHPGIETIFILADPEFSALSSSLVREIHRHGGDISPFIPEIIKDNLNLHSAS